MFGTHAIAISVSALSLIAIFSNQATAMTTSAACAKIVSAYETCQPGIDFDPKTGLVELSKFKSRVACSDGLNLDFYTRLDHMDIASELEIPYETGRVSLPNKAVNDDGGRMRFDPLYFEVYGASKQAVMANLVNVKFLNQVVLFNKKNGAAAALSQVNVELSQLVKSDKVLADYLKPWLTGKEDLRSMTFNWRKIAQSPRLSNHSFGAAIDLNDPRARGGVYWLWELAAQRQQAIKKRTGKHVSVPDILKTVVESQTSDFHPSTLSPVPQILVDVFEKHGFVWGGKWFHFDGMHFEYRPEFLPTIHPDCPSVKLAGEDDVISSEGIVATDATGSDSQPSANQWLMENAHFD